MDIQGSKRPRKNFYWTRELTFTLIKQYESHPNLWDVSSENYKNKNIRKSSLDKISSSMNIPVQELNEKIHNLRCQFLGINRKRLKSGQADGDNFVVRWQFYDALKFIDGSISFNNETKIDSLQNEDSGTEECNNDAEALLSPKFETNDDTFVEDTSSQFSPYAAAPSPSTSRVATPSPLTSPFLEIARVASPSSTTVPKKEIKKGEFDLLLEQQAVLNRCLGIMSEPADSFKIFGDFVADELRSMNSKAPDLQVVAKRNIQRILLDMQDMYASRTSRENKV